MCCVLDVIYKHIQLGECYDFWRITWNDVECV
jgi:hypothetical protein